MSEASFRDALRVWARDALATATIADIVAEQRSIMIEGEGGAAHGEAAPKVQWSFEYWRRVVGLSSWESVSREAATWPRLMEHVDTLVGTHTTGAARIILENWAHGFVPEPKFVNGGFAVPVFDEAAFVALFERFTKFMESDEVHVERKTIIEGLRIEPGCHPIQLFDSAVLDQITREEFLELGDAGLVGGGGFIGARSVYGWPQGPQSIFRWTRAFRKVLGDWDTTTATDDGSRANENYERALESLFIALSITKTGFFRRGGTVSRIVDWPMFGNSYHLGGTSSNPLLLITSLAPDECAMVARLFDSLQNGPDLSESVSAALRRFSYGLERSRPEDRFLDNMIAAEALFMDQASTTEITYKMSIRTAFALERSDPHKRRVIFENMKAAYGVRSTIAHGSLPKPKQLVIDGNRVSLTTFVDAIESYVRTALRETVLQPSGTFLPEDWDDFIVGPAAAAQDRDEMAN
jgi:Apea-like HEPN